MQKFTDEQMIEFAKEKLGYECHLEFVGEYLFKARSQKQMDKMKKEYEKNPLAFRGRPNREYLTGLMNGSIKPVRISFLFDENGHITIDRGPKS